MKKLFAALLALTMIFSLCSFAGAEEYSEHLHIDIGNWDVASGTDVDAINQLRDSRAAKRSEEYFQSKINQVKESLAVPTGNPIHDNSDTFKKEKALLNWLNKMSVSKLFDWFDAIQETTVNSKIGKNRWRTETIERDRLFLRKLGVIK